MSELKDVTKTPLARRLKQSKNKLTLKTGLLLEGEETKSDEDNPRAAEIKNQ